MFQIGKFLNILLIFYFISNEGHAKEGEMEEIAVFIYFCVLFYSSFFGFFRADHVSTTSNRCYLTYLFNNKDELPPMLINRRIQKGSS